MSNYQKRKHKFCTSVGDNEYDMRDYYFDFIHVNIFIFLKNLFILIFIGYLINKYKVKIKFL